MSTTPYYQISAIYNTGDASNYGTQMKDIVQLLLQLDNHLSIKTVSTDTEDDYDVFLSIDGTNQGFRVYKGAGLATAKILIEPGFYDSAGKYHAMKTTATNDSVLSNNRQICCIVWGIGGCLRHFGFGYSSGPGFISGWYGKFTCSGRTDALYMTGVYDSVNIPFQTAPVLGYSSPYVVDGDTSYSVSLSSFSPGSPYLLSGYNAAFLPRWYQGFNTNHGYLNIKWDGLHSLYQLYAGNNLVSITPGQIISVNGQSIMSVGNVIYAV